MSCNVPPRVLFAQREEQDATPASQLKQALGGRGGLSAEAEDTAEMSSSGAKAGRMLFRRRGTTGVPFQHSTALHIAHRGRSSLEHQLCPVQRLHYHAGPMASRCIETSTRVAPQPASINGRHFECPGRSGPRRRGPAWTGPTGTLFIRFHFPGRSSMARPWQLLVPACKVALARLHNMQACSEHSPIIDTPLDKSTPGFRR